MRSLLLVGCLVPVETLTKRRPDCVIRTRLFHIKTRHFLQAKMSSPPCFRHGAACSRLHPACVGRRPGPRARSGLFILAPCGLAAPGSGLHGPQMSRHTLRCRGRRPLSTESVDKAGDSPCNGSVMPHRH